MKWKLTSKLFLKKNNCLLVDVSFLFHLNADIVPPAGRSYPSFLLLSDRPAILSLLLKIKEKKERMGCWTVIKEEKKKDQLRLKSVLRDYAIAGFVLVWTFDGLVLKDRSKISIKLMFTQLGLKPTNPWQAIHCSGIIPCWLLIVLGLLCHLLAYKLMFIIEDARRRVQG